MRWILSLTVVSAFTFLSCATAQECACPSCVSPELQAAGFHSSGRLDSMTSHEQLYPYDQQDPWLHGQYQRVPSYGGYNSFRPYNYRHVVPQAQISANSGASRGMPYSQQFFNRYRRSYLNGHLHSQTIPTADGLRTGAVNRGSSGQSFTSVSLSNPQTSPEQATRLIAPRRSANIPLSPPSSVLTPVQP